MDLYHSDPGRFEFIAPPMARVTERMKNAVCLDQSYFYPGGGGQLPDRGVIRWSNRQANVINIRNIDGKTWHFLDAEGVPDGEVLCTVDHAFRTMMCQLHTDLHVLNAVVFQRFEGALVTGVQMAADRTARIDFDLPTIANSDLRAMEAEVNSVIAAGLPVRQLFARQEDVAAEPGLIRSRSVAPPPQENGLVRIVEIEGLDRQACGGTHLTQTSQSPPIHILKVENKGQRNRRIRIALA